MTRCCIFCQCAVPPEQAVRKRELQQRRRCGQREMPWLFGFLENSKTQVECRGRVEFTGHPGALNDVAVLKMGRTEIHLIDYFTNVMGASLAALRTRP